MLQRGAFFMALLLAASAGGEQVVRVKDGDSLVVDSGGYRVDVRLAGIDAPESSQPSGDEARSALSSLVAGKEVELRLVGGDAYRRVVAHILVDGVDVNAEMVRRGLAWVPRDYDPPPHLLRQEDEARAAGVGLWAEAEPTPPWVWRKTRRSGKPASRTASPAMELAGIPTVECGAKRTCGQMDSCAEAVAFLRQCEVRTLDGDRDGVPCDQLCRRFKVR